MSAGDIIVLHNAKRQSKAVRITRVMAWEQPPRIRFDTASGPVVIAPVNGHWPQVDAVLNPNSAGANGR